MRTYFRESRNAFPDQRNELIAFHHVEDAVITEFGSAELGGRTAEERAARLAAIAHPDFRAELTKP